MIDQETQTAGPVIAVDHDDELSQEANAEASPTPNHEPTKPLPSARVKTENQLEILRAFAAASGNTRKAVSNPEVAQLAGVSTSTVSSCNKFFADIGLIQRSGRGYIPDGTVFDLSRAHEWKPATAAHRLAPLIRQSWFWEVLGPRLSFGQKTIDEAVQALADAVNAGPDYKAQLLGLIEFCEWVGLVKRENDVIRRSLPETGEMPDPAATLQEPTALKPQPTPSGSANQMALAMNVTVSMDRFSEWGDPEKIKAFFDEWSKLMAAKVAIERMLKEND